MRHNNSSNVRGGEHETLLGFSPCELIKLYPENNLLNNRSFLRKLANKYNLPYANTIEELCEFEKMTEDEMINYAIETDNLRLLESLIGQNTNIDHLLIYAVNLEKNNVIDYLIDKGASVDEALMEGGGNWKTVKYLLKTGKAYFDSALIPAIQENNIYIIKKILKRHRQDDSVMSEPLLYALGEYSTVNTFQLFGYITDSEDILFIFNTAIEYNNIPLIEYILDQNLFNVEQLNEALYVAIENENQEVINMFDKLGINNY